MTENELNHLMLMADKPTKLQLFVKNFDPATMSNEYYWKTVAFLWEYSEGQWANLDLWLSLLTADRPERHHIMTAEAHEAFGKLPDPFKIFRGYSGTKRRGLSWTLDRDKAIWFAKRFAVTFGNPTLLEANCKKKNVLGVFLGKNEKEIVTNPKFLRPKAQTLN